MRKISEMKTKKCFTAIVVIVLSVGVLAGCGKGETLVMDSSKPLQEETTESVAEDTIKPATGEISVGLQDYAGFYCMTTTEQIEDFEVTTTTGYYLNADGTGVAFGQDVVDFTWNEKEMNFGSSTDNFTVESGKLTVNGITYNKIDGNFIMPQLCKVNIENIDNGIYNAAIDESGLTEIDGKTKVRTEIYTVEAYDIVDINRMTKGDVIYINGTLIPVNLVEKLDSGAIEINGGIENMGSALRPVDESNCYVYFGMDDERSYTRHGIVELVISEDVKLIDNSDPTEIKESTGSDAVGALKELIEKYSLNCYNCIITVEEGAIVEINRMYRP